MIPWNVNKINTDIGAYISLTDKLTRYTQISVRISHISLTNKLTRYTHQYQCIYLVNIPEPVQYHIYAMAFPFDLRCQSVTFNYIQSYANHIS